MHLFSWFSLKKVVFLNAEKQKIFRLNKRFV
jgi:hypothetical protein